jgi:hypothetical protein
MDSDLDPRQVRRLVKRVGAYLADGAVREDDLQQVFQMAGADEAHAVAAYGDRRSRTGGPGAGH